MRKRSYHLHDGKIGSAIAIRINPRAKRNKIVEVLSDGTVKIQITAPPVDGKANEALLIFLSDQLDISKSKLEIVAGTKGRDKLISVLDMDPATLNRRIKEKIGT